ncbi:MAG: LPS assembly lipoprotein LptE [Deltaproteobacteria bacterium]|jgi:hypothetical protein|nr:LPS assembly lipoprotein LptE [Deltaproteobacteria bacterium]
MRSSLASLLFLFGLMICQACGYEISPSPYHLRIPEGSLSIYIPVAENRSRQANLGPDFTRNVIERLAGTPGVQIGGPESQATLKLNILSVVIGSSSWEVFDSGSEIPEASSSRTASVNIEVLFTRPNDNDGNPVTRRILLTSSRTYVVSTNQEQVVAQENAALEWIVNDLSQKVAMGLFTEF